MSGSRDSGRESGVRKIESKEGEGAEEIVGDKHSSKIETLQMQASPTPPSDLV